MHRIALTALVMLVAATLSSPAYAFQCPTLIKKVTDATANRYDPAAAEAKVMIAQAAALHAAGKHAESVKMGQDAVAKLGLK
jgi:hypothetical protein